MEGWVDASTQLVTVTSLLSLNSLRVISGKDNPDCYYLDILSNLDTLYPNTIFNFTVSPLSCFSFTEHTFLTPSSRFLFPLTHHDLSALSTWLHARGDARSADQGQVVMAMLPRPLQIQIKILGEELGSLFDELGVAEDCYSVGVMSRVLADHVVTTAGTRPARKHAPKKLSVVFVDRTLDLFGASGFQCESAASLLFDNLEELFQGSNDVKVDLRQLFNKQDSDFVINGCLADSKSAVPMETLLTTDHMTLCEEILSSVEEQIQLDPATLASRDLAAILPETDTFSKYQNFLYFQVLAAILACQEKPDRELVKYLSSTDVSLLWTTLEDAVLVGQLANSILTQYQETEALLPEHIATLLIHLYSLFGELSDLMSDTDAIELAKLKNMFFKRVQACNSALARALHADSDEKVHEKIEHLFARLESISQERLSLTQLSQLTSQESGSPQYTPLLEQLLHLCLDTQEDLVDVEYRSGGLRDLLKTGLGLFTRAVSKPRPAGAVLVYVVGGVTVEDCTWVEEYRRRTGREVYLGGNCLLNKQRLVQRLLENENMFRG